MLTETIQYSGLYAKVKAMGAKLLTDSDYQALLHKASVNDIAAYLKNSTHYREELAHITEREIHRGELEENLRYAKEHEFVSLLKFEKGKNKEFLLLFVLRYEIELLKDMIRMLHSGILLTFTDKTNAYYSQHMTIDTQKLSRSHTLREFVENLKGTAYHALLLPLLSDPGQASVFFIEMTLDVYYFKKVFKTLGALPSKKDRALLEQVVGMEMDVLNLLWVLRCKKYFQTPKEIIYSFLLPQFYRLSKKDIVELVEAPTVLELMELLRAGPYGEIFETQDRFFETGFHEHLMRFQMRRAREEPFSLLTALVHIHQKDVEVDNIIKIIEGIRYGLQPGEIERYLIRSRGGGDVN